MKKIITASILSLLSLILPLAASAQCYLNDKPVPCDELTKGAGKWIIGGGIVFLIIMVIISILAFIFWLVMLIHAASKPIDNKVLWIVLMVLLGIPVSIIYYFIVKRKFDKGQVLPPQPPVAPQSPIQPPTPAAPA
jgi:amino acid transporter